MYMYHRSQKWRNWTRWWRRLSDGPFVSKLDKALSTFYVERQAYYSDHVHRCLKVHHLPIIMYMYRNECVILTRERILTPSATVPSTALLHYPSLHSRAQQVAEQLRKALVLFGRCNSVYEKNYINDDELDQLCKSFHQNLIVYTQ